MRVYVFKCVRIIGRMYISNYLIVFLNKKGYLENFKEVVWYKKRVMLLELEEVRLNVRFVLILCLILIYELFL